MQRKVNNQRDARGAARGNDTDHTDQHVRIDKNGAAAIDAYFQYTK
jgi:hypothetical protein